MIKNYISIVFLALISAMSLSHLSAQDKVAKYKVVVVEKSIDENGNEIESKIVKEGDEAKQFIDEMEDGDKNIWTTKDGEKIDLDGKEFQMLEKRAYKMIVKDDQGNEKTLEWDGEGEMPAEMKAAMEQEGIDTEVEEMIKVEDIENIDVNVEVDASGKKTRKIKIVSEKNGKKEVEEFEFEGDEIPDDIKKRLDGKGIDLHMTGEEDKSEDVEMNVQVDARGKQTKKVKIKSNENGKEEVIEFEIEGDEIPEDVQKILDERNIKLEMNENRNSEKVIKVIKEEKEKNSSKKPQLGVLIENNLKGVLITEVLPESSAFNGGLRKGDIVTAVDGNATKVLQDLQKAISSSIVGDVISVDYLRNGKTENSKVTLQEKVSPFEFETWEEVMNSRKKNKGKKKEITIEKEVIIKKN